MTQKERQERSREEIYGAALKEFGTQGYEGVRIEHICANHGISKGMMYHYFSSKDELFLLCVERTFAELKEYLDKKAGELPEGEALETIKAYLMIREDFFQGHAEQKLVFETAMVHPPRHLTEQIQALRGPLRCMNREFLTRQVDKMQLRPGMKREMVVRYLESVQTLFPKLAGCYENKQEVTDLHGMLTSVGELLEMILLGVVRQPGAE